jgi:hypothetical protein
MAKEVFVIALDVTAPHQVGQEVSIRADGLAVVPPGPNV